MNTQSHSKSISQDSAFYSSQTSNIQFPSVDREIQRILNPSQSTNELLQNDFDQKISEIQDSLTSRSNFLTLFQQMLEQQIQKNTIASQGQSHQEANKNNDIDEPESNQDSQHTNSTSLLGIQSSIKLRQSQCSEEHSVSQRQNSCLDTYRICNQEIPDFQPETTNKTALQQQDISFPHFESSNLQTINLRGNCSMTNIQSQVEHQKILCQSYTQTDLQFQIEESTFYRGSKSCENSKIYSKLIEQVRSLRQEKKKLRYFVGEVFGFLKSFLLEEIFRKGLFSIVQTISANYQVKYQQKMAQFQNYRQSNKLIDQKQMLQLKNCHQKPCAGKFQPQKSIQNSKISLGSTISIHSNTNGIDDKSFNSQVSQFDKTLHSHNKENYCLDLNIQPNIYPNPNPKPVSYLNNLKASQQIQYQSQQYQLISFRPSQPNSSIKSLNQNPTPINVFVNDSSTQISAKYSFSPNLPQQSTQKIFSSITIKPKPIMTGQVLSQLNHNSNHNMTKTPKNQTENHPLRQVYLNEQSESTSHKKPFSKNNSSKNRLFFKTKSISNNQTQPAIKSLKNSLQQQSHPTKLSRDNRQMLQTFKKLKFTIQLPSQLPSLCYKQNPPPNSIFDSIDKDSTYVTYESSDFAYQGYTQSGRFHGSGKLFLKGLRIYYQGEFQNHQLYGKGTLWIVVSEQELMKNKQKQNSENNFYTESRQNVHKKQLQLTGNFAMNKLNGYAKIYIQQHSWEKDQFPTYKFKDRFQYESTQQCHISGEIYTNSNSEEFFGLWKDNQLIGVV